MLTEIADLPSGVIGFEVVGKLAAGDYSETLAPAVKRAADDGDIRLIIVLPTFEGIDPEAIWEDTKLGLTNWGAWKRVAFVTDVEWMATAMRWFGWMTPGEAKHFPLAERDAAIAWAAGSE
jgi:SpoIIAA-like